MNLLKSATNSLLGQSYKKFYATVAGEAAIISGVLPGLSERDTSIAALALLAVYILAQGNADRGKSAAMLEIQAAEKGLREVP